MNRGELEPGFSEFHKITMRKEFRSDVTVVMN